MSSQEHRRWPSASSLCDSSSVDSLDDDVEEVLARACLEACPGHGLTGVATLSSGEILAKRYVVGQLLARGGMGEVYVAFDQMLRQPVAIKTVVSTLSDDPRAIRRLCREVRLARRVRHPNVCRVHDIGIHDSDPRDVIYFMTMDFIAGESLRKRAHGQGFSVHHAVQVALQLLSGLDAMHAAGVLHRDLKSDNIMISGTDEAPKAVLIDFGLSRSLGKTGRVAGAPMSGSMGYMAPEQVEGKELSLQTDIFGFGVVLFELLTGVLPFERRGPQPLGAAKRWSAAAPSAFRAEVPSALDEVVARCLHYSPSERYPNANSVVRALDRLGSRRSA